MKTLWANAAQGVAIGVASGLILTVFVGAWNTYDAHQERQEQIRFLAATIDGHRQSIEGAEGFYHEGTGREISQDEIKKAYLTSLYRQVQAILEGRASRLTFDEIRQVREVFFSLERHPNWIPNDKGYYSIFQDFAAIEWLELKAPNALLLPDREIGRGK